MGKMSDVILPRWTRSVLTLELGKEKEMKIGARERRLKGRTKL